MPLNRDLIGKEYEEISVSVTRDRALAFADAIRERSPVFREEPAARKFGFDEQLAPPTFPVALQIQASRQVAADPDLRLDYSRVVHGEQEFEWLRPIFVGDELSAVPKIADIKSKGPLEFLVIESEMRDGNGETVVNARSVLISRETAR
ncbi:MAG: MaoC family dehydratase N-terminal domain-containing protein [Actinomycetota bacterium]